MLDFNQEKGGLEYQSEATQYMQAQAGCQNSLNTLLARHEKLVHLVANRQQLCGLDYEEAAQAGRRGLWRAILGFEPQRGVRFSTYAYKAIMRYIWAAVQSHGRACRREAPLAVLRLYTYGEGVDPAVVCEWEEICQSLRGLVARLPERLRLVIVARYGLGGEQELTLKQIGQQLGVSRERVRQMQLEALVWLRQPAHSQELRSLLARHTQSQYELADELAAVWLKQRGGRHGR
jgi:RNA polymerase primary sigma factor/RNA polymerase sigma factor